ncbi:MAG TPA: hypothetical protein VLU46_00185, partial [Thermoanaerobaculia bacterium]|nr:hypothetical protein [Thermoanaerobaculia bacterium]
MRKRLVIPIAAAAVVLVAVAIVFFVALHRNVPRHRVFRPAPGAQPAKPPAAIPPVDQWTETFDRLAPAALESLLDQIEQKHPDLYARYQLAYVDARMLIEKNELKEASKKLAPYLDAKSPFR